jgi:hypothetical protein
MKMRLIWMIRGFDQMDKIEKIGLFFFYKKKLIMWIVS